MTPRGALLAVCVLLGAALPVSYLVGHGGGRATGTVRLPHTLREAVPTELGGWRLVKEDELREYERQITKVDDYVSRLYAGPRGEQVLLYMAYHGNRERGLATYYHNASVCYPAAGWELAKETFEEVTLHDAARQVPTCRYDFRRPGERIFVLTFFRVDDELLDQSPRNKPLWTLAERLTPHFDDSPGTFVQVQIVARVDGDENAAVAAQTRFLQTFGTALLRAVP